MNLKTDKEMQPHVLKVLNGEYDIPQAKLKAKPHFIDIGANCGAFVAWALDKYPDATIDAYEPNPETFKLLKANFGKHPQVTIKPYAVTADGGYVTMFEGRNNSGETSCFKGVEQTAKSFRVRAVKAANLPTCDFLKLDCEGMEAVILSQYDFSKCSAIAMEWHGKANARKCMRLLTGNAPEGDLPERGIFKWVPDAGEKESTTPTMENVFIAVPIHYQPTSAFTTSCMAMQRDYPGAQWEIMQGDSHPDRARNRLAKMFLDSDKDYMLFLDADLKFVAAQVASLVTRGKDMICGFYAKKTPGPAQWVGNALSLEKTADGLSLMREAATGCLLIHRRVFETMKKAYPEIEYTTDPDGDKTEWDFFKSGVYFDEDIKRRRWLSEDWAFSMLARKCGFDIYGDTSVVCLHEGACFYPTEPSKEGA